MTSAERMQVRLRGHKKSARWTPGSMLIDAFTLAAKWHGTQTRKGNDDPYISHLMAVSALVIEYGGTEVQAAAALLHDILEDTGCNNDDLLAVMGDEVTAIVKACTHVELPKTADREDNFRARKQIYLDDWFIRRTTRLRCWWRWPIKHTTPNQPRATGTRATKILRRSSMITTATLIHRSGGTSRWCRHLSNLMCHNHCLSDFRTL